MKKLVYLSLLLVLVLGTVTVAAQAPEKSVQNPIALGTRDGIDNISASTVNYVTPDMLPPGSTFDLCFNMTNTSGDLEYLDGFDFNLPDNWTVNYVTDVPGDGCGFGHTFGVNAGNVVYWYTNGMPSGCGDWVNGTRNWCANVTVPDCSGSPWDLAWNIWGDGYGSPPHSVSGAVTKLCQAAGVYLAPDYQQRSGCEGESVTYELSLYNNTGAGADFALTYTALWNTEGPASIYADDGETVTFEVTVDIPCGGDSDDATITAEGNGYSDWAVLHTYFNPVAGWNPENADLGPMPADVWGMGYAQTGDWLWIVAGVQAGALSGTTHYYDLGSGAWVTDGNLATGAVYRTSATVADGVLYKLGGSTGSYTYTGLADKYAGGWSAIATEPNSGRMDNVTAGWGGYAWSITGYGNDGNVRKYDPASNSWTVVGTPPAFGSNYARSGCQMGDKVYLYGDAAPTMTGLWEYNMAAGTWTQMTPSGTPPPYTGIWAPAWVGDPETGLCYMTGGATTPGAGNLKTTYVYDAWNNAWLEPLPEFTSVRDFHAAFLFDSPANGHKMLCVAGGNNGAGISSTQCIDLQGCPPCGEDTLTCGDIFSVPLMDPYGRMVLKWVVKAVDEADEPVGDVLVTASLTWPNGGPVIRTRITRPTGFCRFNWGSRLSGMWSIDVTDMDLDGYTFVDGPNCSETAEY